MNPEAQAAFERMVAKMPPKERKEYLKKIQEVKDEEKFGSYFDRGETTHHIVFTGEEASDNDRDTVGGVPYVSEDFPVPICKVCKTKMALSLQFDIRSWFNMPFAEGSHLLVYQCENEQGPTAITNTLDDHSIELPDKFWEIGREHCEFYLLPPGSSHLSADRERQFVSQKLRFFESSEIIMHMIDFDKKRYDSYDTSSKVGGLPAWLNAYHSHQICPCGGKMALICQIGYVYLGLAVKRPRRTNSTFFLSGVYTYILGCDRQCDPRAILAVSE
ncbi:Hypothetical protein PBC10988_33580 [Planctomycetales bacterium 10988]|nr:Hypothetical protein PBC10988_33580 [Planctomycetales bacterium 10988]